MTQTLDGAIVTEVGGHVLVTSPIEVVTSLGQLPSEMAAEYERSAARENVMWLTGRFVEAERANVNGAIWSTDGLEAGQTSIVHMPLNFLHRSKHVIGTFTDARLLRPKLAAAEQAGSALPYIAVNAAVWKDFFPYEARMIEIAAASKVLFSSVECQSRTVRCESSQDGRWTGCGKEFPFTQTYNKPETVCSHLRERTSQRRMIDPTFNAGAVIVPPVKPGWREAHLEIRQEAEQLAERVFAEAASARSYTEDQLVELMLQVVAYGNTLG